MTTNYIYLLQEREFIKTKENIYKVGMTEKENHKRFNQYPKGSILLFQMICRDCKTTEKQILKRFKSLFDQKKDIGNEYFEGNYEQMIDAIYTIIKDETTTNVHNTKDDKSDDESVNMEEDTPETSCIITTYEDWSKFNDIDKVIITNKKTHEGFLKLKGHIWSPLCDTNNLDMCDEDLVGYINHYKTECVVKHKTTNELITRKQYHTLDDNDKLNYEYVHNVEYNVEQILQDTLNSCYVKNPAFYNMSYHEYVCYNDNCNFNSRFVIYNALTCTFAPTDEITHDKILTDNPSIHITYAKNAINIDIIDGILNSLLTCDVKRQYKQLVYNVIVKREAKQIIFHDYNEGLLTIWLRDLLFAMSNKELYIDSYNYYDNKKEFRKALKTNKYRLVIIHTNNLIQNPVSVSVETQINEFSKMGFKYFIVRHSDKHHAMYNIQNCAKYLCENKDSIIDCIKEENNYVVENYEREINDEYFDYLFYRSKLLYTNFLKWCCVK